MIKSTDARQGSVGLFAKGWALVIRTTELLCIVCILSIATIVLYEIIMRFAFDAPTLWAQEIAVYLLIALAFLGLAPTQESGEHIRIDLLIGRLSTRLRTRLELVTYLATALLAIVAAWGGWQTVQQSLRFGRRSLTLLGVPVWIPQLMLPLGMGLLAIGALWATWRLFQRQSARDD